MARGIIVQSHCDWCDAMGLQGVVATERHTIGIDGDEPKALDFCPRCEMILEPIIRLLQERGQDLEPPKRHKRAQQAKQPEATPLPEPVPELAPPLPPEDTKPNQKVICPLHDDGKLINYSDRNMHAERTHQVRVWDVEWGDPEGALTDPCKAHQVCVDNNLAFTTKLGLTHHIRLAPLDRIDG